ncbi:hypothetical protein ACSCBZ_15595 [Streptomyces niveiscabiei]|uniref:hypothetical protein n=1 Tax=Streptomyces niveiscabiei TaxID=164115 RepID=UPI003EC10459
MPVAASPSRTGGLADRVRADQDRQPPHPPPATPSASGTPPRDAAIQLSGASGDLPGYIPRDLNERLRAALDEGRFVLLVGGSSVGKTRTLYEALLARHHLPPLPPHGLTPDPPP